MSRFLEVLSVGKFSALEGVIRIGEDGYAEIHNGWLKELLIQAGYQYEESN